MRSLLAFVIAVGYTFHVTPSSGQPLGGIADATARVYEAVANFQVNHDELQKARYAFVVTGSKTVHRRGDFRQSTVYWIGAQESRHKRLDANSISYPSSTGVLMEYWSERIRDDGRLFVRSGPYGNRPILDVSDQEDYRNKMQWFRPIDPLVQSIAVASSLGWRGTTVDFVKVFLQDDVILESAKYNEEDDLYAHFRFDQKHQVSLEVTFNKTSGFMPSIVTHVLNRPDGVNVVCSHTKTTWFKQNDLWLPRKIVAERPDLDRKGGGVHHELEIEWRIGDALPKQPILNHELADWKEPVRELFDANWQRSGVLPPFLAEMENE